MNDAASFDAIMQCNLLEVFCEAIGAGIFVTDKLDQLSFASTRLLHLFPIRESVIAPGGRARDLYSALFDAGIRFGEGERAGPGGREEWVAERIACAWKERVDKIEKVGPERWVRIVSRRFSSGLGFVIVQDVSEQKKKDDLLKAEQDRVRLTEDILDTLPVAVAVKDRNLDYVAVNQEFCRLIGKSRDSIVGRGSWASLDPELAGQLEQMDWQLLASGEPAVATIVHRLPDGSTSQLERRARRLGNPGSHYIAISLTEPVVEGSEPGLAGMADQPVDGLAPHPSSHNVLYLTALHGPNEALKLALRAHDVDLCHIREVPEFAAFLPAARAAGVGIDLMVIDFDFDPTAFDIAAASGIDFHILPPGADETTVMASVLHAFREDDTGRTPAATARPGHASENALATEAVTSLDILAVEDNPVNRMVLEQMLGGLGVDYRIVATGAEGLAELAAHTPRLVLCDMTLPDMDAIDFARELRQIHESVPLVALLPSDSEDNRQTARNGGFDDSLAKPLSAEALGAVVLDCLSRRMRLPVPPLQPAL